MARTVTSVVAAVAGVATAVALAVTPPVAHAAVDPFSDRSGPPGADRGPERSQAAGHAYRHGLVPTREADAKIRAFRAAHPLAGPQDLSYGGGEDGIGVTTGSPKVYLVSWGSQWGTPTTDTQGNVHLSGDGNGMAPRLQQLFEGIGTANELWSGVTTQYCEGITKGAQSCPDNSAHVGYPTGGALAGVWVDSGAAEPAAADPRQIGLEAIAAASHFGNTNAAANRNAQYVVVSSHGLMPDNFPKAGFCAWHDWNGDGSFPGGPIQSTVGDIAFTNLPYVTDAAGSCGENFVHPGADGVLDGVTIVEGHEYAETITDQNPSGGWNDAGGEENADKCAWLNSGPGAIVAVPFTTGSFAMQSTWSNDGSGCQMSHPIVGGGGGNDFTVSVSPSASPLTGGQSATLTATIAKTAAPGFGATVALSDTILPAGITA